MFNILWILLGSGAGVRGRWHFPPRVLPRAERAGPPGSLWLELDFRVMEASVTLSIPDAFLHGVRLPV